MIGYLGVPGALVALPYRGGLSTSTDRPSSFVRTLGGKRKAFIGPRARREWSVSVDLMGSRETAGLIEIARSGGEVLWYPADATSGNLLSPQASGFDPVPANATSAGLVQLPDGTVAASVAREGSSGTTRVGNAHGDAEWVPVRPGQAMTVGAWGLGGARFQGFWRDATGGSMGSYFSPADSHAGWQWREHTLTPPDGAAFIELHLFGGTQYALPSVAWGAAGQKKPGRGCSRALVHGMSESLSVIARDDSYGSLDVTITEVG